MASSAFPVQRATTAVADSSSIWGVLLRAAACVAPALTAGPLNSVGRLGIESAGAAAAAVACGIDYCGNTATLGECSSTFSPSRCGAPTILRARTITGARSGGTELPRTLTCRARKLYQQERLAQLKRDVKHEKRRRREVRSRQSKRLKKLENKLQQRTAAQISAIQQIAAGYREHAAAVSGANFAMPAQLPAFNPGPPMAFNPGPPMAFDTGHPMGFQQQDAIGNFGSFSNGSYGGLASNQLSVGGEGFGGGGGFGGMADDFDVASADMTMYPLGPEAFALNPNAPMENRNRPKIGVPQCTEVVGMTLAQCKVNAAAMEALMQCEPPRGLNCGQAPNGNCVIPAGHPRYCAGEYPVPLMIDNGLPIKDYEHECDVDGVWIVDDWLGDGYGLGPAGHQDIVVANRRLAGMSASQMTNCEKAVLRGCRYVLRNECHTAQPGFGDDPRAYHDAFRSSLQRRMAGLER